MATMEAGEDEEISPVQEIDFCTLGMFIIGKAEPPFNTLVVSSEQP